MNAIKVKVSKEDLELLLKDPDAQMVVTKFEGKGQPECIIIVVEYEPPKSSKNLPQ